MAEHHKYTNFYRAFEERHRGSRELIESRLEVYLPFVEPLKSVYEAPEILDLGCGRGEWLELSQRNGFQAKGVDLDEGMLLACRELNLDVYQTDVLDYLRGQAADSLSVVSAFHVVEHIPFEALRQLVDEAYRVLKPGGLLILETPNSENLLVGTSSFYLDPTHQRPIPALLLTFVVEYAGFERVKTLYLQESPSLATAQQTTLINVLDGVSPDYAVIAQKKATEDVLALFDEPFERSYGLSLNTLAERYDQQAEGHAQWLQNEWNTAQQRIEQLCKWTGQLETKLAAERQKAESLAAELSLAKEQYTQHQVIGERRKSNVQLLQNEWDATKQRVEELNKHTGCLETELNQLRTHTQWLQNEYNQLQTHAQWLQNESNQLQTHAQGLQNELNATRAKVHELTYSSHHWWTVADQLRQEQQSIYASKFWRFTWPLRKIMQAAKWTLVLPARTVRWAIRLPKRIASRLSGTGSNPQNSVAAVYPPTIPEESINNLSPRAALIYTDLKKAIEARKN